ncbi:MAG: hypothetical protein O3B95_07865 [Chloroflexi bacterium]|nr:hypothetical protein [Chloroflexota bacterium]
MVKQSQIQAIPTQLDALEDGSGMLRWTRTSIVEHSGPDALDLLHRLTTKELLSLPEGGTRRTVLTSDRGRVVDVFLVARTAVDQLLLVSDSDKPGRMISAIDYYTIIEEAELADRSDSHVRVTLVGPRSVSVVKSVLGFEPGLSTSSAVDFLGTSLFVFSDASRGVVWFDIVCPADVGDELAAAFNTAGSIPIDLEQFELFRIDHAIPGSDREYGEHANPIESGLLDLIDFDKGCYVGQEVIARLDAYDKVQRNLRVLESSAPIEPGTKLQFGSKPAGTVTSASSIRAGSGNFLALGLVRKAFAKHGTSLVVGDQQAVVR